MTNTLYTHAGFTTVNGRVKARFTNHHTARVKRLNGADALNFIALPEPMNKLTAANYLKSMNAPEVKDLAVQAAIARVVARQTPKVKAPKASVTVTVKQSAKKSAKKSAK